jgi:protein SCO1/2
MSNPKLLSGNLLLPKLFQIAAGVIAIAASCTLLAFQPAHADHLDSASSSEHQHHTSSADPHAAHHHMAENAGSQQEIKRTSTNYALPSVSVVREDGKTVDLAHELNDHRAVILNFIFTTCTEICPLTTRTFEDFQDKLGNERSQVHMISISIDPEHDTPATLKKYAKKYQAGTQWNFYTGTAEASIAIQKAFEAYRGDKMNHVPVTYLRAASGNSWLRLDGFVSADELLHSYHELSRSK